MKNRVYVDKIRMADWKRHWISHDNKARVMVKISLQNGKCKDFAQDWM